MKRVKWIFSVPMDSLKETDERDGVIEIGEGEGERRGERRGRER